MLLFPEPVQALRTAWVIHPPDDGPPAQVIAVPQKLLHPMWSCRIKEVLGDHLWSPSKGGNDENLFALPSAVRARYVQL